MKTLQLNITQALGLFFLPVFLFLSMMLASASAFAGFMVGSIDSLAFALIFPILIIAGCTILTSLESAVFKRARQLAPHLPLYDNDGLFSDANRMKVAAIMCRGIIEDFEKGQYAEQFHSPNLRTVIEVLASSPECLEYQRAEFIEYLSRAPKP